MTRDEAYKGCNSSWEQDERTIKLYPKTYKIRNLIERSFYRGEISTRTMMRKRAIKARTYLSDNYPNGLYTRRENDDFVGLNVIIRGFIDAVVNEDINSIILKPGDKVHYAPEHYKDHEFENGVVKSLNENNPTSAFIVYHCGGNWDDHENYTAASTNLKDLRKGWVKSK